MGAISVSFGSPHVRFTPMGRTCGEPDESKEKPNPKDVTALFGGRASPLKQGGRFGAPPRGQFTEGKLNKSGAPGNLLLYLISFACLRVRPMGVRRTCRQANEV